ncbi:aldehyde dehydrogenase family protein [Pseudomonas sp. NPDC087342]|uniref:aldehyde dehydrogenase family protein n=1 Tax=Pseudomonas sp. NPDC087342 TaxID=3364437 RepID=UPI00380AEA8C
MSTDLASWNKNSLRVRIYGNHIDGAARPSVSGEQIERVNPATGELVATWPNSVAQDVDDAVDAALAAFEDGRWSDLTGAQRAEVLHTVAGKLRENTDALALIESLETGKTLEQAREEIPWAADMWDYAAGQARGIHGDSHSNLGPDKLAVVLREPVGPVGLVTPWNYPAVVLSQKLPYALAAGCTVVVKPSEFTSGTTLEIAKLLEEAGLPKGVFNVVTGLGARAGQRLADHKDIRLISFTGSTATAQKIVVSAAGNMKKVVLELGGKNPTVVFADANIEAALDNAIKGFVYNSGAECCSGSRVLVQESIVTSFTEQLCEKLKGITVGDPLDPSTKMGAIINQAQFDKINGYIEEGKSVGRLAYGGSALKDLPGYFIEPTVFTDVPSTAKISREEVFGPVIVIIPFSDMKHAIELANDTDFGLASSVWTSDLNTATTMARKIRSGIVWVNTFLDVASEIPIGGSKQSGYGRENGRYSIEEYTNLKTIVIQNPATSGRYL